MCIITTSGQNVIEQIIKVYPSSLLESWTIPSVCFSSFSFPGLWQLPFFFLWFFLSLFEIISFTLLTEAEIMQHLQFTCHNVLQLQTQNFFNTFFWDQLFFLMKGYQNLWPSHKVPFVPKSSHWGLQSQCSLCQETRASESDLTLQAICYRYTILFIWSYMNFCSIFSPCNFFVGSALILSRSYTEESLLLDFQIQFG